VIAVSEQQDVQAPGWIDPRAGRRNETGATAVVPGQRSQGEPVEGPPPAVEAVPEGGAEPAGGLPPEPVAMPELGPAPGPGPASHPTTPVDLGARPRPRLPRRDPLIRMGPWAPVAGAAVGLVLGIVVVLFLAPAVDTFDQRLSLVFVVLGLALLGAGGTLLADEVRLLRRGAQAAEARASNVGVIAGLLNGLTPARLLITASAFSLLLSAYVTHG
jgi:hypothetical protein